MLLILTVTGLGVGEQVSATAVGGSGTGGPAGTNRMVAVVDPVGVAKGIGSPAEEPIVVLRTATPHPSVTPDGGTQSAAANSAHFRSFTVHNTGTSAGTMSLSVICSGSLTNCTSPPSIVLAAGAQAAVTVGYQTGAAGTTGQVKLRATNSDGGTTVQDSGWVSVTAAAIGVCSSANSAITPCNDGVVAWPLAGSSGSRTFQVQNKKSSPRRYAMSCEATGAIASCGVSPASVNLAGFQTALITVSYVVGSSDGFGTLRMNAFDDITFLSGSIRIEALSPGSVSVTPTGSLATIDPGQSSSFAFTVRNNSALAATYSLSALCSPGFASSCSVSSPVTVNSGASQTVNVSITGGSQGESGSARLSAVHNRNTAVAAEATSPEIVVSRQSVSVGPKDRSTMVAPSVQSTVRFSVHNGGDNAGTFDLALSCSGVALSGCSAPATVTAAAGATAMVAVSFTGSSQPGQTGSVRLVATQQGASAVSDTASIGVTIGSTSTTPDVEIMSPQNAVARDLCVAIAVGAGSVECGDLRIAHALPAVRTKGKLRAPMLLYNSQLAAPQLVIAVDVTPPLAVSTRPDRVELSVQLSNGASAQGSWTEGPTNGGITRRVAVPVPVGASDATALHTYSLEGATIHGASRYAATRSGSLIIVDRRSSPFGAGWWLAGLEQIRALPNNRWLWIGGDGSALEYVPTGSGTWVGPALDRPDTLRPDGTGYMRVLPHGTRVRFDATGLHIATINRLGDSTAFSYDAGRRLRWITLPATSGGTTYQYEFKYDPNNLLTEIVAPGGRITDVTVSASGILSSIRDPDNSVVSFGTSGPSARITSRTDRRGAVTHGHYDAAGRFARDSLFMGAGKTPIVRRVRPGEVRGLAAVGDASSVDADSAFTEITSPRVDKVIVTRILLDRFGAPRRVIDPLGCETSVLRGDARWPALATRVRYPNGRIVTAAYDGRGNIQQSTDSSTFRDGPGGRTYATTQYAWMAPFDFVRQITLPEGEIVAFGYDGVGNRIWEQAGDTTVATNLIRRVRYVYDVRGLLRAVVRDSATAGDGSIMDSLYYDGLDNLLRTRSPLGFSTWYHKDALGRDTLVVSPIDALGQHTRRERTFFDVADQDTLRVIVAGPISGTGTESITMRKHFDLEGNLDTLRQLASPDINAIGWQTFAFGYDAANRKVTETLVGTRVIPFEYDPAGNLLSGDRNGIATTQYDELNRPIRRVGSVVSTFRYDVAGNLVAANNPFARVTRAYNRNGSISADTLRISALVSGSTTTPNGDFTRHVYGLQYRYDLNGRRTWLRPSINGSVGADSVVYGYDAVTGALALVDDGERDQHRFVSNHLGDVVRLTRRANRADSIVDVRAYDREGRLASRLESVGATVLHDEALTYDARGKLVKVNTIEQAYSPMGALVLADGGGTEGYEVDALGNRRSSETTNISGPLIEEDYFYQAGTARLLRTARKTTIGRTDTTRYWIDDFGRVADQLRTQVWSTCGSTPCSPDITAREERRTTSIYDGEGRLVRTSFMLDTIPAPNVHYKHYGSDEYYAYDALGRRVWVRAIRGEYCSTHDKQSGCRSTITRTIWDGSQVLYEIRSQGGIGDTQVDVDPTSGSAHYGTVRYTHGLGIDAPLAAKKLGGTLVMPSSNAWGRMDKATCPAALCTSAQLWIPTATGTMFGASVLLPEDGPPSWHGSLIESGRDASGFLYRRNRYYDPATGRFTQEDPIGLAGGPNLFVYAGADPVSFTDPFGLCPPHDSNPYDCGSTGLGALVVLGQNAGHINRATAEFGMMGLVGGGLGAVVRGLFAGRAAITTLGLRAAPVAGTTGATVAAMSRVMGNTDARILARGFELFRQTKDGVISESMRIYASLHQAVTEIVGRNARPDIIGQFQGMDVIGSLRSGVGVVSQNGSWIVLQRGADGAFQVLGRLQ